MPQRYFFNLRNGPSMMADCVGVMLDDATAARQEARLIARDFVHRPTGAVTESWSPWSIEVRDGRGRELYAAKLDAAAEATGEAQSAPAPVSPPVVHLHTATMGRRLDALENQKRDLWLVTASLMDRQRYVRNSLRCEMVRARSMLDEARRTLRRSMPRTAIEGWTRS
jgi:hypothetical protein